MNVSDKRLNTLIDNSINAAMAVLTVGLPEFPKALLKQLREDIEMHLSDTIESHVAGLTEEEYRKPREPHPFDPDQE